MKKINILFVGMSDNMGGIETYLINIFRSIDKSKFDVYFLAISKNICFEKEIINNGGHILYVTPRTKNYVKYIKELKKAINSIKFDIIEFELMNYSLFEPFIISNRLLNTKIILHSHISSPDLNCNKILNYIGKRYVENKKYTLVACSKNAGKMLFENKEFKIFNNAIDIDKFLYNEETREIIRKELNIDDEFVIGHVGRFDAVKNHEYIIKTFKKFVSINPKSILLLIGTGPLEQKIKNLVNDMELTEKVMFLGNKEDIYRYYQAMDVLIFPSKFEGLGIVVIEAQTAGLPCIISNTVPDEVGILDTTVSLPLNDYNEWVRTLYNSINLKRVNREKEMKQSDFHLNKEIKKIENTYINLLGGNNDE